MPPAALASRVARYVWSHPSNRGRRGRQLVQAVRFQVRGRVAGRPTVVPVGRRSHLLARVGERGSALVAYANPHDHDELLVWERALGPGDVFVDVGANVGAYAMWAAERGAHVIAFEPNDVARSRLEENAELNGFVLDVRPQAVTSEVGPVGMTTDQDVLNHLVVDGSAGEVDGTTLDVALADVPQVRGLKVDVEGYERLVLEGAEGLLAEGRIDLIQVEWNALSESRLGESRAAVARLLTEHGYHLFRPSGVEAFDEPGADVFAARPGCQDWAMATSRGAHRTPEDLRLNLGSGPVAVPGWDNVDRSPSLLLDRAPLVKKVLRTVGILEAGHMASWSRDIRTVDLRKPLPYEDGSARAIYTSHTLEHLYRDEAQRLLDECFRIQAPDGVLRVALPDAEAIARELLDDPTAEAARRYNQMLNTESESRPPWKRRALRPFQGSFHKWQPTAALLREMLEQAGYPHVVERGFRQGELPGLADIEHREASFFVEARKTAPPA